MDQLTILYQCWGLRLCLPNDDPRVEVLSSQDHSIYTYKDVNISNSLCHSKAYASSKRTNYLQYTQATIPTTIRILRKLITLGPQMALTSAYRQTEDEFATRVRATRPNHHSHRPFTPTIYRTRKLILRSDLFYWLKYKFPTKI